MQKRILKSVPKYGDRGTGDVKLLQEALMYKGYNPGPIDDDFGDKTRQALVLFQRAYGMPGTGVIPADGGNTFKLLDLYLEDPREAPGGGETPWLDEAKKHAGKKETDSAFSAFMTKIWALVGLPGFKGIAGSARAWCAIFVVMALSGTGYHYISKGGAGAANQGKVGQAINWKVHGIPKGAIVHVNSSKCGSGSGNHITFADGSCAAKDIVDGNGNVKASATFPGFGGNQGNMVKTSWYRVSSICNVRWPDKKKDGTPVPLPPPVTVSNGCNGKPASGDSTR